MPFRGVFERHGVRSLQNLGLPLSWVGAVTGWEITGSSSRMDRDASGLGGDSTLKEPQAEGESDG